MSYFSAFEVEIERIKHRKRETEIISFSLFLSLYDFLFEFSIGKSIFAQ